MEKADVGPVRGVPVYLRVGRVWSVPVTYAAEKRGHACVVRSLGSLDVCF